MLGLLMLPMLLLQTVTPTENNGNLLAKFNQCISYKEAPMENDPNNDPFWEATYYRREELLEVLNGHLDNLKTLASKIPATEYYALTSEAGSASFRKISYWLDLLVALQNPRHSSFEISLAEIRNIASSYKMLNFFSAIKKNSAQLKESLEAASANFDQACDNFHQNFDCSILRRADLGDEDRDEVANRIATIGKIEDQVRFLIAISRLVLKSAALVDKQEGLLLEDKTLSAVLTEESEISKIKLSQLTPAQLLFVHHVALLNISTLTLAINKIILHTANLWKSDDSYHPDLGRFVEAIEQANGLPKNQGFDELPLYQLATEDVDAEKLFPYTIDDLQALIHSQEQQQQAEAIRTGLYGKKETAQDLLRECQQFSAAYEHARTELEFISELCNTTMFKILVVQALQTFGKPAVPSHILELNDRTYGFQDELLSILGELFTSRTYFTLVCIVKHLAARLVVKFKSIHALLSPELLAIKDMKIYKLSLEDNSPKLLASKTQSPVFKGSPLLDKLLKRFGGAKPPKDLLGLSTPRPKDKGPSKQAKKQSSVLQRVLFSNKD